MQNAQNYTSAATSINRAKLPSVYNKISSMATNDAYVLDYGCGRYIDHICRHVAQNGGEYLPYDLYNMPMNVNLSSIQTVENVQKIGGKMVVVCANVLNVIDSDEVVESVADTFVRFAQNGAAVFVTVYEGDKSSIGRVTGADQYQRNQKTRDYLIFFGANFTIKKGVITNAPELVK